MTRAREDRLFDRYRRTGDVRALAAVFDRVAPVLWRIAVRLSPDVHAAEDAVQNSFLVAIEDADTWQSDRALLPWMLGILTNQARWAKRRASRPVDRERLPAPVPLDPSAVAEDTELRAALGAALDRVPAAYRETLKLHLLHGSRPNEIAAASGLRPGTVRMQLRRGLAHLRRNLPKGLVTAGTAGALTPSAHASMRQYVLSKVTNHAAISGAAVQISSLGALAMKKNTIVLVTLLAMVLVSGLAWYGVAADTGPTDGIRDELPFEPVNELPTQSVPQQLLAIERAKVEPEARDAVAQAGDETVEPAGPAARVRGRCVDAGGKAMTGATVTLHGRVLPQRLQRWTWDHAPMRWRNPESIVTGDDGRFEFEFLAPSTHFFTLALGATGHVEMHSHWAVIHPGDDIDLGDVTLLTGCRVTGRVRDTDLVAREGILVQLEFEGQFPTVTHGLAFKIMSGPGGEFAFAEPVPTGRWSVNTGKHPRVGPHEIEIKRGQTTKHLVVVVATPADVRKIEGTVVDALGVPVPKAVLQYQGLKGKLRWVRSAADGSFVLMKPHEEPDEPVEIRVTKTGHEELRIDPVPWGTRGLVFTLSRGARVHVAVVRAEDSTPVEGYTVTVYPTRDHIWSGWGLQTAAGGRHHKGRTTLGPLRSGKYLLMVEPSEDGLATSKALPLEIMATDVQRTIALPRVFRRRLELRTASEASVGVAKVELIEPVDDPITLRTRAYPVAKWRDSLGGSKALLLQLLKTDADGRAELVGPPRDLVLRIHTFEHGHRIITGVRLDAPGNLVITLDASATLRGTVGPITVIDELRRSVEDARFGPRIELRRTALKPTVFPPSSRDGGRIGSSGAYRIGGIPPGLWDVHLTWNTIEGVVVRAHTRKLAQVGLSRAQDVVRDLSVPPRDKK